MVDCYVIEWPPRPRVRPKALWAHFRPCGRQTFKSTRRYRHRQAERAWIRGAA